jgi:lysophospholipase L1-like esterase
VLPFIPPLRSWRGPLVVFLGALLFSLSCAEFVLRAVDFSYYWALYKQPDPHRGWAPVPGTEAWQRLEGKAFVEINEAGQRDDLHAQEKPPGTFRIAVLGDSFTEAVQVPLKHTFWSILENELKACTAFGGSDVEVINFGVSGYSTAQELLTLRHHVWTYEPDLVLLAFFQGNDLTENTRALDGDPMRPYFLYANQDLLLDASFRSSDAYRRRASWYGRVGFTLVQHSRLLQAVYRAKDLVTARQREGQGEVTEGVPQEPRVDNRIYGPPRDPEWRAAWRVTEGLLKQMHREVRRRAAHFLVVTLSTGAQVYPDPTFRAYFKSSLGIDDLFYTDHRIRELGEQTGFSVLNLAPQMQLWATFTGGWLHGFENSQWGVGHWNRAGHRLAGEMIADALCELDS